MIKSQIIKKYNNIIYIFEKTTGMTALFSHKELELLKQYASTNIKTDFINRLFDLGILVGNCSNLLLNALQEKEIYSPQSLHIDITNKCPLKCNQCYKTLSKVYDMPLIKFQQIIEEAKNLKVFQIAIGGGEPLCHGNLMDFIKLINKTQMSSSITTSGYGLTKSFLENLQNAGLNHMQISLNGSTNKVNKLSRDGFDYAINALELLSNSKISYGINFVARKDNIYDFFNIVDIAKKYKADNINILRYKPSSFEDYNNLKLDNKDFILFADKIKTVRGVKIKVDSAYSNLLIYINNGIISKNFCGCGASKNFIAITNDGKYKPCSHMSLVSDSDSIKSYWNNDFYLNKLRDFTSYEQEDTNSCYSCYYFNVCGGCRAICENINNNIWSEENDCPVFKRRTSDV